ncbi:calmodulin-binding transcription activator 5 isoform X4 [Fagus crenata]
MKHNITLPISVVKLRSRFLYTAALVSLQLTQVIDLDLLVRIVRQVGDEERIHVYYAHGLDNPTFVRRCYWLLDKSLEHIVLVHNRETQELQGSPGTPVNSNSSSGSSAPLPLTKELDSGAKHAHYGSKKELLGDVSSTFY